MAVEEEEDLEVAVEEDLEVEEGDLVVEELFKEEVIDLDDSLITSFIL